MLNIERDTGEKIDIVVMIQGDEPMLYPDMIEESIMPLMNDNALEVVNLMSVLKSKDEQDDPNVVKVVVNLSNEAMYFSREPVPSRKKAKAEIKNVYKQVPIIPFRRDFLIKYSELAPTPLEIIESVDMLRILEHGYSIKMVETRFETSGVDTPDDLKRVERLMSNDKLFLQYGKNIYEQKSI
jgi:3-deoxy-manno-octulosonate cytidylyltransferase (CMP-KDO synthetase)